MRISYANRASIKHACYGPRWLPVQRLLENGFAVGNNYCSGCCAFDYYNLASFWLEKTRGRFPCLVQQLRLRDPEVALAVITACMEALGDISLTCSIAALITMGLPSPESNKLFTARQGKRPHVLPGKRPHVLPMSCSMSWKGRVLNNCGAVMESGF